MVETRLVKARQREVRGRQTLALGHSAVGNQRQQFVAIGVGQALDAGGFEALATEAPVDAQFAAIDASVQRQPVSQRRVRALVVAGALAGRNEQCALVHGEAAVELAEVVEGDARHRQPGQGCLARRAAQVAQGAEADALVRHRAQLLLDALDRCGDALGRRQA